MTVNGINHVTLRVRDLDRAEHFYTGVLGLKRVGERPGMRFYSSGRFAHELALIRDPGFQPVGASGLAHVCFNVADEDRLRALYRHCLALGWPVGDGVDHRVMHSFYLRDPDGYVIELGTDRPIEEWADDPQAFAEDRELAL